MNWKVIITPAGVISYAACNGERLVEEFKPPKRDVAYALAYEAQHEFENSLNDFLADSKAYFEARRDGRYYKRKFELTASGPFRALQKKLEKAEGKSGLS